MLTVVVIISILAGVSLPAVRGLAHGHVMTSASQQLLDDLALARRMAISSRTSVFVVFVPTNLYSMNLSSGTAGDASAFHQLWGKTYTSYALYADRMIGDQPGQSTPRYFTEWKTLPEGVFIAPLAYVPPPANYKSGVDLGLTVKPTAAFPLTTSATVAWNFPCVAFDYTGELIDPVFLTPLRSDQVIPLDRGSVFYQRDANGNFLNAPPDLVETPKGNAYSPASYIHVRVNHLTGRARIEQPIIQ